MKHDDVRFSVLAEHLDDVDYYSLLEIPQDASLDEIRTGFHEFALRFHPDQQLDDSVRRDQSLKIFKRGAEAYRVLKHPLLRQRYDERLKSGSKRLPVDAMQLPANAEIHSDLPPAARAFYEKALESLQKGDFGTARLHHSIAAARSGESRAVDKLLEQIQTAERSRGSTGRR